MSNVYPTLNDLVKDLLQMGIMERLPYAIQHVSPTQISSLSPRSLANFQKEVKKKYKVKLKTFRIKRPLKNFKKSTNCFLKKVQKKHPKIGLNKNSFDQSPQKKSQNFIKISKKNNFKKL